MSGTPVLEPDGFVNRDWWQNPSGEIHVAAFEASPEYADTPTGSDTITSLRINDWDAPWFNDFGDNFGQRVTGYLVPDESGPHRFWIAADDVASFRLSRDADPANLVEVASVPAATGGVEFNKYASQKSALIDLVAGQSYALEIVHREGYGGDNAGVWWRKPSHGDHTAPAEAVPSAVLSSVPVGEASTDPAVSIAGADSTTVGDSYTITLSSENTSVTGWTIDWGDGTIDSFGDVSAAAHTYAAVSGSEPLTIVATASTADGTLAADPVSLAVNAPTVTAVEGDGQVFRDYWDNIYGSPTVSSVTADSRYPNNPTGSDLLESLEAVNWNDSTQTANWGDNYGQRIHGYLIAPESGEYTFWINSDDQSRFSLSTDSEPANLSQLAAVEGFTAQGEWNKLPGQRSIAVSLVAGQSYAFEVVHREGAGGDHLAVGWRRPSDGAGESPAEIIPGSSLSTYPVEGESTASTASITGPDIATVGSPYTLSLATTGAAATGWAIDWGDGTTSNVGPVSSATHTYDTAAARSITATAITGQGAVNAGPLAVSVAAEAAFDPTLVLTPGGSSAAGRTFILTATIDSPDTFPIGWEIDWGDGNIETFDLDYVFATTRYEDVAGKTYQEVSADFGHAYAQAGSYDIAVTLIDSSNRVATSDPINVEITAAPALLSLAGTVRDFRSSHPDFENDDAQVPDRRAQRDLVEATLGPDGLPVFNAATTQNSIQSAATFDQWFRDGDASQTISSTLELNETAPGSGIYEFRDLTFFPIDGRGFSVDPAAPEAETFSPIDEAEHNYHFTFELHNQFTYRGGETFEFFGDDDLWVFIDGQRVIDLGGLHEAQGESVSLDTLGLTVGETYDFDLFFAERHRIASRFEMQTSIVFDEAAPPAVNVTLVEDADLITTDASETGGKVATLTVPENADHLRVDYRELVFDAASNADRGDVNDAFELVVRRADGSALATIGSPAPVGPPTGERALPELEAQFSLSQGRDALTAPGTTHAPTDAFSGSIYVDISGLPAGEELILTARLLNNDADNTSRVTIDFLTDAPGQGSFAAPTAATPTLFATADADDSRFGVAYSRLDDVSSAFDVAYAGTTYDSEAERLYVATDLVLAGSTALRDDLLIAVTNVRDQATGQDSSAQLASFDGVLSRPVGGLSAGTPYLRLSSLLEQDAAGFFARGASVENLLLTFESVQANKRFDFDLVVLGQPNEAPAFTSDPYAIQQGQAYPVTLTEATGQPRQVLEIVRNENENVFTYAAAAADPNGDRVFYDVVTGPRDLTIDRETGEVSWQPLNGDAGVHQIRLRATDEFGAFDPAADQLLTLHVVENVANRAPQFTSDPVTTAEAGEPYTYFATAFDPDGDDLTFDLVNGPGGDFAIDAGIGEVTWTPTADQIGQTLSVLLSVQDGRGGEGLQRFDVIVEEAASNRPPVIVTEPRRTHFLPAATVASGTNVSPEVVSVTLDENGQAVATVQVTLREQIPAVDVFLLLDDTGSFSNNGLNLASQFPGIVQQLVTRFPDINFGFGVGRFEEYGSFAGEGAGGRPFTLNQAIIESTATGFNEFLNDALSNEAPGDGGDTPETAIEALFQLATGAGFDGNDDGDTTDSGRAGDFRTQVDPGGSGDVPAFASAAGGTVGGGGFRIGSLPIVLLATDTGTVYQPDGSDTVTGEGGVTLPIAAFDGRSRQTTPGGRGATIQETLDALNEIGAKIVGIGTGGQSGAGEGTDPRQFLEALSVLTGAVNRSDAAITGTVPNDPIDPGDPLYFQVASGSSSSFADGIVAAIGDSLSALQFNVDVISSSSSLQVTNVTGVQQGVAGDTLTFDVLLTGDGSPQELDLLFVQDGGSGISYGSIPTFVNAGYSYLVRALDPDDTDISFEFVGDSHGATLTRIGANEAIVNWDPDAAGDFDFAVRASDGRGGVDLQEWSVNVGDNDAPNAAPVINNTPRAEAPVGETYSFQIDATDPDGERLSYFVEGDVPDGLEVDVSTGLIEWTPSRLEAGSYAMTLVVRDVRGLESTRDFTIDAVLSTAGRNSKPLFESDPSRSALVGAVYRYDARAVDPDGEPVTYRLVSGPESASIDESTGALAWSTRLEDAGVAEFVIQATDPRGGTNAQVFRVDVAVPNDAPVIQSEAPAAAKSNQPYRYRVDATDANGDVLTYEVDAASAARGITIDTDGLLEWTPNGVGTASIGIRVSDGRGGVDTEFFDLVVAEPDANTAPRITSRIEGLVFLNEGFNFQLAAEDLEDGVSDGSSANTNLVWSVDQISADRGVQVDPFTGNLTWTPRVAGTFVTTVTVTDSGGASASSALTLPVNVRPTVNQPAEFTSSLKGPAVADRPWSSLLTTTDADGDTVTVTLLEAPAWLDQPVGTTATGSLLLSGTPTEGGTNRFVLSALDADGEGQTLSVDLITIANAPPVIVKAVQSAGATLGEPATYDVQAFDPNGDAISFELVAGAGSGDFGPVTAVTDENGTPVQQSTLTYTPHADGNQQVLIRVSDGASTAEHVMNLVVVDESNQPPTASLSVPGFVLLGETFTTRVDAADADGDPLTYAFVDAAGRTFTEFTPARAAGDATAPVGLTIDGTTGVLSWTPVEGQQTEAGADGYAFTIRVSDGRFTLDLGPAEVAVIEQPSAAVNPPQFVRAASSASAALGPTGSVDPIVLDFDFIDFDAGNAVSIAYSVISGAGTGSFDAFATPAAASDDPATPSRATLAFTPDGAGEVELLVTLTDDTGRTNSRRVTLSVIDPTQVQRRPVASLTARTATAAGEAFVAQVDASDPNGDTLTYAFTDASGALFVRYTAERPGASSTDPIGMAIDPITGRIFWTPGSEAVTPANGSPYRYTIAVSDGQTPAVTVGPVALTVISTFVNQAPVFETRPDNGAVTRGGDGLTLTYDARAVDPDGDVVTYGLASGPAGASIDRNTGRFVWRPDANARQDQTFTAEIVATDTFGLAATQAIELRFTAGNAAPRITSLPPQPGYGGERYEYLVTATDADNDAIAFSLEGQRDGVSITQVSNTTARVVWANPVDADSRAFEVVVTDARGLEGRQSVNLTIGTIGSGEPGDPGTPGTRPTVDVPPTIVSTPTRTVVAGQPYRYRVIAEDADATAGDPIEYGLLPGHPDWLSIDSASGVLSGIAPAAEPEADPPYLTVTATQAGATALQGYSLQVTSNALDSEGNPVNNPPVVEPAENLVAFAGASFSFDVAARDPEGDVLAYALVDAAGDLFASLGGFAIDQVTGRVTRELSSHTDPGNVTFRVQARDTSGASSNIQTFDVEIKAPGDDLAPSVGLRANTNVVEAGRSVAFVVDAADDLGLAEVYVEVTAPSIAAPVRLDLGSGGGLVRYTPDEALAGEALTVTAFAVDTSGNVSEAGPLAVSVVGQNQNGPQLRVTNVYPGHAIETATELEGAIFDTDGNLVYYSLTLKNSQGDVVRREETGVLGGGVGDIIANLGGPGDADVTGLISLNPLSLANGEYTLELLAQDAAGSTASAVLPLTIQVDNEVKLGNFALSFTDLSINVGGIPLTATRSYDTLDSSESLDFGHGWQLDIATGGLTVVDPYSTSLSNEFPAFGEGLRANSRVEVELPGGEKLGFTVTPVSFDKGTPAGGILGLAGFTAFGFAPDREDVGNLLEFEFGEGFELSAENREAWGVGDILRQPDRADDFLRTISGILTPEGGLNAPLTGSQNAGDFGIPADATRLGAFRVTTQEGTKYRFDQRTGQLLSVEDAQGNTVTYGRDIVSTNSEGEETARLDITRDNQGRITRIADASGDDETVQVSYAYDALGNLASVTDRSGRVTTLQYGEEAFSDIDPTAPYEIGEHILTSVTAYPEFASGDNVDALDRTRDGVDSLQVAFDRNGLLAGITDASGASAGFDYTLSGEAVGLSASDTIESVTDADGFTTEVVRDGEGNTLRTIQQVEASTYLVTVFEYDANGNQTSSYQPFEATGAGNERFTAAPAVALARSTYDRFDRVLSSTDAFDQTTRYTYDGRGNLRTVTDADGNVTTSAYNSKNQLTRSVDASGNATEYAYDRTGNLARLTQFDGDREITASSFEYDRRGRLVETTGIDPDGVGPQEGITRFFAYNAFGDQVQSWFENADGVIELTQTRYDGEGRVVGTSFLLGGQVEARNNQAVVIGASEVWSTSTEYDGLGRAIVSTDRFGNRTATFYDARGNVVESRSETKDEVGATVYVTTRTAYDANGRAIASTDPFLLSASGVRLTPQADLRVTHTLYDGAGRVTETRRVSDVAITGSVSSEGGRLRDTDFAGSSTDAGVAYDASDILSRSLTRYDDAGRVFETETTEGLVTRFAYDAGGRQSSVTIDPQNTFGLEATTSYTYDALGRQATVTDSLDRVTSFAYDSLGRVTATRAEGNDGDASTDLLTRTVYDDRGRRVAEIDALGRRTDFAYDDAGRLTGVTLPGVDDAETADPALVRPSWTYGYDSFGNRTSITDPLGRQTAFGFDAQNRETSRTLPLGTATSEAGDFEESRTYFDDASDGALFGLLKSSTDFEGNTVTYGYDEFGRQNVQTYAAANGAVQRTVTTTFDGLGRVTRVVDSEIGTTSHVYDAEGRLLIRATPQGTLTYTYDQATGRQTSVSTGTPGDIGTSTRYEHDVLGRLTAVVGTVQNGEATNQRTEYVYNVGNELVSKTTTRNDASASGVTTAYAYDSLGRLASLVATDASGGLVFSQTQITHDAAGNRTSLLETVTLADGSTAVARLSWAYDGLNRLVRETRDVNDDGVQNQTEADAFGPDYTDTFAFDLNSNRIAYERDLVGTADDLTVASTFDLNDRLLVEDSSDDAEDTTYTYDLNGSQLTKTADGETITYRWDALNRLVGVDQDGNGTFEITYTYDANGVRVTQTVDGVTTTYLHDGSNPTGYSKPIEEIVDGQINRSYVVGLVVESQFDHENGTHAFVHDAHGSTRAILDAITAEVVQRLAYDAFGETLTGAALTEADAALTTWLFTGDGSRDVATGLTYHLERYRRGNVFVSTDPYRGDAGNPLTLHHRGYVHQNPSTYYDPSGNIAGIGRLSVSSIQSGLTRISSPALARGLANGRSVVAGVRQAQGILQSATSTVPYTSRFLLSTITTVGVTGVGLGSFATDLLTDLVSTLVSYRQVLTAAERSGEFTRRQLEEFPAFFIQRSRYREIYDFRVDSLSVNPQWFVLQRNPIVAIQELNRRQAQRSFTGALDPFNNSIDEFPYASTIQGGLDVDTRALPESQNFREGGDLGRFYLNRLRRPFGMFLVVPAPFRL